MFPNRQTLIAVATRASARSHVPLDVIAKEAGVGIGTLYRHFPTRQALVEAVYHDQVDRLRGGAQDLLASDSPAEAFRLWMDLFIDWAATKHGMMVEFSAGGGNPLMRVAGIGEELSQILGVRVDVVTGELLRDTVSATALVGAIPL